MSTSAIFEYAYRNPESDIAEELFNIYDDVDYGDIDEEFGDTDVMVKPTGQVAKTKVPLRKKIGGIWQNVKNDVGQVSDAVRLAKGIKAEPTGDKRKDKEVKKAVGGIKRRAILRSITGVAGTQGRKDNLADFRRDAINEAKKLRHPDKDGEDKPHERTYVNHSIYDYDDFDEYEEFGVTGKAIVGAAGAGLVYGGYKGVKGIVNAIEQNKIAKEEAERLARELERQGKIKTAAAIMAAAGIAGGAAAVGRHVYLKHRMKQTGAKSAGDVKRIVSERKAYKKVLESRDTPKAEIKRLLKAKFGY